MTNTKSTQDTITKTSAHDLIDAETGANLGPATEQQIEASTNAPDGVIAITGDGSVAHPGSWDFQNSATHTVWVDGIDDEEA